MKTIILSLMTLIASSTVFADNRDRNRFSKAFSMINLIEKCAYGDSEEECKSAIIKSLKLGATKEEIVSTVMEAREKSKKLDTDSAEFNADYKEILETLKK